MCLAIKKKKKKYGLPEILGDDPYIHILQFLFILGLFPLRKKENGPMLNGTTVNK